MTGDLDITLLLAEMLNISRFSHVYYHRRLGILNSIQTVLKEVWQYMGSKRRYIQNA